MSVKLNLGSWTKQKMFQGLYTHARLTTTTADGRHSIICIVDDFDHFQCTRFRMLSRVLSHTYCCKLLLRHAFFGKLLHHPNKNNRDSEVLVPYRLPIAIYALLAATERTMLHHNSLKSNLILVWLGASESWLCGSETRAENSERAISSKAFVLRNQAFLPVCKCIVFTSKISRQLDLQHTVKKQ